MRLSETKPLSNTAWLIDMSNSRTEQPIGSSLGFYTSCLWKQEQNRSAVGNRWEENPQNHGAEGSDDPRRRSVTNSFHGTETPEESRLSSDEHQKGKLSFHLLGFALRWFFSCGPTKDIFRKDRLRHFLLEAPSLNTNPQHFP